MNISHIHTNKDLDLCVEHLNRVNAFVVDLEFDKNHYYYGFNLCLVQIASAEKCFIIDPLSKELDIQQLFPVLENENIQKVVYAFGEDIRLLHSLGCFPKNLFDAGIAGKLLNYPPMSLARFLDEILHIKISKSQQKSNWCKRPLSPMQLSYAAEDVLYLLRAKEILLKQAAQKNIWEWIAEENAEYDQQLYAETNNNNFIKEKDKNGLSEYQWFLFKKLLVFREAIAKQYNKPGYRIMDKAFLKEIAQDPSRLAGWQQTKGIFRVLKTTDFQNKLELFLKQAVKEAQQKNMSKTKRAVKGLSKAQSKLSREKRNQFNQISRIIFKPLQKQIAEDYGENAAVFILNKRVMSDLIWGRTERVKNYKKTLLLKYARKLDIDLNPFLKEEKLIALGLR